MSLEISSEGITKIGTGALNIRPMPIFRVSTNSTQSITSGTSVKIPYNIVEIDTEGWYDTINYRYVPQIAGYYQFNLTISATGTSQTFFTGTIYKNGSTNIILFRSRDADSQGVTKSGAGLVYLNGSTDYVEGYVRMDASSGSALFTPNIMSGFLVRAD